MKTRTMTPEALASLMVQEQKLERLRDLRRARTDSPERELALAELAALQVIERRLEAGAPL